ncbi:2-oxoglutarate dehydrogenase complex dihydrolipoyllysine-residue succinyltransferase [Alicyclobacillus tolerans]|uniref:2-oxoglutarate dehydrogenase complex dihydrolipoyllysine-residue succinyltransferase n=1 Tax=Alicyclobacillus tolerans TaxID=90970 RepID=UPI001EFFBDE5|nr:2-oxoglutarate dehydrogenase complex dihydrolipoyllysine-residue succinyltransferase [Alicyclobacillus tolerans]MCF8565493.1 2-oxoglutarate dehydrogenase complex dihydrolipoyllysine-residue succinyltransferase [Alicyclobacillus tolerans]
MSEIKVPELGESIVEATVGTWLKGEGDTVEAGESVVELETDKVNVEVIFEEAGTLSSIRQPTGQTVQVGDVLAVIESVQTQQPALGTSGDESREWQTKDVDKSPLETSQREVTGSPLGGAQPLDVHRLPPRATPAMRRAGLQQGSNSATDAVLEAKLPKAVEENKGTRQEVGLTTNSSPTLDARALAVQTENLASPREERVRMSRRRITISRKLVETQRTAAMLTTFNDVDMSAILDIRKRRRESFRELHEVSLGLMSFFTKAVIGALKEFPRLNAEIQGEEMILKHYYDIGIAVSTESGLVVPVLRDADRLNFAGIEQQIASLAKRARENALELSELQGGTFTITNGGVFGSLLSTPILNGPQVGILGMHKIEERPIARNGEVLIRPMMYLALSYDHRIVDGSEAVRFLATVKKLLEDPEQLLLEG